MVTESAPSGGPSSPAARPIRRWGARPGAADGARRTHRQQCRRKPLPRRRPARHAAIVGLPAGCAVVTRGARSRRERVLAAGGLRSASCAHEASALSLDSRQPGGRLAGGILKFLRLAGVWLGPDCSHGPTPRRVWWKGGDYCTLSTLLRRPCAHAVPARHAASPQGGKGTAGLFLDWTFA